MKFEGSCEIQASQETVWTCLNDPDTLKRCLPGCEELERVGEASFKATVVAKIGPVKAKFAGAVSLEDIEAPHGYRITGEGQGVGAGFAKGGAVIRLKSEAGTTTLSYVADVQIGGKLAQLGSRLIEGTARKLSESFFVSFAEIAATYAIANAGANTFGEINATAR